MPDLHMFDRFGSGASRCALCGWPGDNSTHLSERDRERHHAVHERERARTATKTRNANLRLARRLKRLADRERRGSSGV